MKRLLLLALIATGVSLLSGCGGTSNPRPPHPAPPTPAGIGTTHCNPAPNATMGVCVGKPPSGFAAPRISGTTFPDVSEWEGCLQFAQHPPFVVIRLYEAGLAREDRAAACDAAALRAKRIPFAGYSFLRPGSCTAQADTATRIARSLGVSGAVIADAEVFLPAGFVSCFEHRVVHDGFPAATYTSPGTWAGGSVPRPLWVATYGPSPGCVEGVCSHAAWQFSSSVNCHGIAGDCSLDSGLIALQRVDRHALLARRATLRYVLLHYGCRRRVAQHEHLGPRCKRWFAEGNRINAELGRA